jgi:hypothetical protein
MKKIFTCVALACSLFATTSVFAQDAATNKGDVLFDIGVGLIGNEYAYSSTNYNYNNESRYQIPTFSVALQKAFWDDITIGGQISFNAGGSKYDDYYQGNGYYRTGVKNSQFNSFITARGEYHFNRLIGLDPKFDLYAGALVGFRISNNTAKYTDGNPNDPNNTSLGTHKSSSVDTGPVVGPFGGFRYYFANNLGVYAEVGWAITAIRGGLVWRL